jgi:hypothetical protein
MQTLRSTSVYLVIAAAFILLRPNQSFAEHIIGGDISWECIHDGPDAGKFVFYLKLYSDCSASTQLSISSQTLELYGGSNALLEILPLMIVSQTELTTVNCGVSCSSANPGDVAVEEFLFKTEPTIISGVPLSAGYRITYNRCCRNNVDNIVYPQNEEIYYSATMYPYNGRDLFPCYDSGPQFAETPVPAICAGYELRYAANATDPELDSLSYEFAPGIGNNGYPLTYESDFSYTIPLPGPTINTTYDLVTLDSLTGMLEYDSPTLQGRWVVVVAVDAWRCGQRISRTIREMTVTAYACAQPNNIPSVTVPTWTQPATAANYNVTVTAGDTVNFTLDANDFDLTGGQPQEMTISCFSNQFGAYYTNADSGCSVLPCATLSNDIPPFTTSGAPTSTTLNWVTSCDHVMQDDVCANGSSTYNFTFKYQDNFCPANGTNMVNIAVTVLADSIVPSPQPHCVNMSENGDVEVMWNPSIDPFTPPAFGAYTISHSTSINGPFIEIGVESNINTGSFLHSTSNVTAVPSLTSPNYYQIRTRSGCGNSVLELAIQTLSSLYLTVDVVNTDALLTWNAVATPPLPSASSTYDVYREYPIGTWVLIATTSDTSFTDPVFASLDALNYRVEIKDALPCASVSNVAGYLFDGISDYSLTSLILVQPNPNTGSFTVSMDDGLIKGYQLLDSSGRVVAYKNLKRTSDRVKIETSLSKGSYFLHLETERGIAVKKIVVTQ